VNTFGKHRRPPKATTDPSRRADGIVAQCDATRSAAIMRRPARAGTAEPDHPQSGLLGRRYRADEPTRPSPAGQYRAAMPSCRPVQQAPMATHGDDRLLLLGPVRWPVRSRRDASLSMSFWRGVPIAGLRAEPSRSGAVTSRVWVRRVPTGASGTSQLVTAIHRAAVCAKASRATIEGRLLWRADPLRQGPVVIGRFAGRVQLACGRRCGRGWRRRRWRV
jgi:hypothetical protein